MVVASEVKQGGGLYGGSSCLTKISYELLEPIVFELVVMPPFTRFARATYWKKSVSLQIRSVICFR